MLRTVLEGGRRSMRAAMVGLWGESAAATGLEAKSCGDDAGVTGIEAMSCLLMSLGCFKIQRAPSVKRSG
ncbi:MAG: hypothetical protein ACYCSR_14905 [Thiomonas sp.]